jgi:hypothetical protein
VAKGQKVMWEFDVPFGGALFFYFVENVQLYIKSYPEYIFFICP